jgi:SAM-dependent methyltransferase
MVEEVRLLADRAEERANLLRAIRTSGDGESPIRVLEAGCGRYWPFHDASVPMVVTGVDLDADALRLRREDIGDLDEEILGDLRTVELPPASFDVAYCSFLLEHVEGAETALDNIAGALRPGGRLVLRVPDGDSVFGWLAKRTPHRTHVWYRRHVERKPDAGKPGHAPYPTVYDDVVSVAGMRDWADRRDFKVVDVWSTNYYLDVFGPLRPLAQGAVSAIAACSRGRVSGTHNNLGFVLEKVS